jgi:hypothetical protein
MIIELGPDALPRLRQLAMAEVRRWPPRTSPRRTAAALYAALVSSRTVPGAMKALEGFCDPLTQRCAIELLHQLAVQAASITHPEG